MEEENKKENNKHHVCLECKGESNVPGVCETPGCPSNSLELSECDCTDGLHNDSKPKE